MGKKKFELKGRENHEIAEITKDIATSMFPSKKLEDLAGGGFTLDTDHGPFVSLNFIRRTISIDYHKDKISREIFNTRGDALRLYSAYEPIFREMGYGISLNNIEGYDL